MNWSPKRSCDYCGEAGPHVDEALFLSKPLFSPAPLLGSFRGMAYARLKPFAQSMPRFTGWSGSPWTLIRFRLSRWTSSPHPTPQ